jgi:hypothetical protein
MVRALLLAALCAFTPAHAAGAPAADHSRVEVAPTWTSIYVGTVSLRLPAFTRRAGGYESTYAARVFPYFFANESGTLRVELDDEALARLGRGEPVDFTGAARNAAGEARTVSGRATPEDALRGRLKVKVRVSAQVELIFNTTYQFGTAPASP